MTKRSQSQVYANMVETHMDKIGSLGEKIGVDVPSTLHLKTKLRASSF